MQKNVLSNMIAAALTLAAGVACAQSSVTLYGLVDVSLDNVHKKAGLTTTGGVAAASTVTRISPSIAGQSMLGFKGTEDIGGGYKGSFVLEGQFSADTGAQNGQDSRMWGRQAYVGLTTPVGEVRLGRQYAPIFYSFASSTVEAIGASDLMASGLIVNNLQVRQDNQVSYWAKAGGLTGALSYATNAGVAQKINGFRVGVGVPSLAQIVGGSSAGAEDSSGRGRSVGVFLNYAADPALSGTFGLHYNRFGDAQVVSNANPNTVYMHLDKYLAYALGVKYTMAATGGTVVAANFHQGNFSNDVNTTIAGPKVQTLTFGFKHPIDKFAVGVEAVYSRFTNFTKGKDLGLMFAGDYNLSKRTKVYARAGVINDIAGKSSATEDGATNVIGGPLPVLTGFGSVEVPFFAGGSANAGATTRVVSLGLSHAF